MFRWQHLHSLECCCSGQNLNNGKAWPYIKKNGTALTTNWECLQFIYLILYAFNNFHCAILSLSYFVAVYECWYLFCYFKPFYGGKLHRVSAEVKNGNSGDITCKIQGEWNGNMDFTFTNVCMQITSGKKDTCLYSTLFLKKLVCCMLFLCLA